MSAEVIVMAAFGSLISVLLWIALREISKLESTTKSFFEQAITMARYDERLKQLEVRREYMDEWKHVTVDPYIPPRHGRSRAPLDQAGESPVRNESIALCPHAQCARCPAPALAENFRATYFGRTPAYPKHVRYLFVRKSVAHQVQDFQFALREALHAMKLSRY